MGLTDARAPAEAVKAVHDMTGHRFLRYYAAILAGIAILAVILAIFVSRDPSRRVTSAEFGPAWPLTISNAVLTCGLHREITITSHGTTYTLNGPNKRSAYDDVAPIWAGVDDGSGKRDLTPLIEEGLKLCR